MNDPTDTVEIVQADKDLLANFLTDIHGDTLIVVSFEDIEQVASQDFEDHAKVVPVVTFMDERVQQAHHVGVVPRFASPSRILMVLFHLLQDFDFIESSFHVVWATLLNFDGDVGVEFEVLAEPHGREVAPAQLLNDHVAVDEYFADVDGMIASDLIVFDSLVLGVVVLIELQQEFVEVLGHWFIRKGALLLIFGVDLLVMLN
jgi:hypothetical protein